MEQKDNNTFRYTYSAREQEELKRIRRNYLPPEENKMDYLRRLDAGVYRKATTVSLVVGILGALLLGIGMCGVMVFSPAWFIPGIIIGIVSIVLVAVAYPVYQHVLCRERKKIAPEVLRLTEELMK